MTDELILEPDPSRVMEGLRDTGYVFNTAMADIVDNSIAADATIVKVYVNMDRTGDIKVYVADNGHGMDFDGLKNAMRYGAAERTDPGSLGKFGLGLKTASTAFCRCLSVVSKVEKGDYKKVRWDLDHIVRVNKWQLLTPEIDLDEIELLEGATKGSSGTLVIWEKVDRLLRDYKTDSARNKAFARTLESLRFHFSMVYERFLDPEFDTAPDVHIFLNDKEIMPWDPFCRKEPITQLVAEQTVEVELPNGKDSSFLMRAWVLPRVEQFSSPENYKKAVIKNDTEGIYVYRENRLISSGGWLGTYVSDPHFSLLRVEFSFDHTLDDAFNVDIKKSRIMLSDEIFDYIANEFLTAPRRCAEQSYRKGANAKTQQKSEGAHDASNNVINEKAPSIESSKVEVLNKETGDVVVSNSQGRVTGKITIKKSEKPGQTRVVPVSSIDSNMLWEPVLVDEQHAVSINQSHPFYQKIYSQIIGNTVLVTGLDSLIWSLAEAEWSTYNEDTKEQYEDMRIQVSRILKKLVNDLPEPSLFEEDE